METSLYRYEKGKLYIISFIVDGIYLSMKVAKFAICDTGIRIYILDQRIQLSLDLNEWMEHVKNRYLLIWPSPFFFSVIIVVFKLFS